MKTPKWFIAVPIVLILGFGVVCGTLSDQWRKCWICLISGLFGFILKYGPFGFTCTFRTMLKSGNFTDMRDMLMFLFFATLLINVIPVEKIHPLLYPDSNKGSFSYSRSPIGVSLALGAVMFGIGMQLGSGCASGTLVGMGNGFVKSWVVIIFFIVGATVGSTNSFYHWWSKLPATDKAIEPKWYFILIILFVLYLIGLIVDLIRAKFAREDEMNLKTARALLTIGTEEDNDKKDFNMKGFIYKIVINLSLAICITAFFLCTGSTIGVMGVFAHIGAQFLKIFKVKPQNWDFFVLHGGLLSNMLDSDIFISDVSMILGSFLASIVKHNFGDTQENSIIEFIKGIFGGFLMGLGARMAYGCNIGSMVSGITSCSIHGFVWMISAIAGSAIVIYTTILFEHIKGRKEKNYQELK